MCATARVSSKTFGSAPERRTARNDTLIERFDQATVLQTPLIASERLFELSALFEARPSGEHSPNISVLQSFPISESPWRGVVVIHKRSPIQHKSSCG